MLREITTDCDFSLKGKAMESDSSPLGLPKKNDFCVHLECWQNGHSLDAWPAKNKGKQRAACCSWHSCVRLGEGTDPEADLSLSNWRKRNRASSNIQACGKTVRNQRVQVITGSWKKNYVRLVIKMHKSIEEVWEAPRNSSWADWWRSFPHEAIL